MDIGQGKRKKVKEKVQFHSHTAFIGVFIIL